MVDTEAQQALEISAGFVLDQVKFARQLFDVVDALIMVAVTQANVDPVIGDPELQRAYATYEAPPPDALRRPISINALARSLRLPFETVRRRVSRLVLLQLLKVSPEGVWTPAAQVRSPLHRKVAEAAYARTLALHQRLAHLPQIANLRHAPPWPGPPPLRAAARISADYLLRAVDVMTAELGDPLDAAVWLEILRSNSPEPAPRPGSAPGGDRRPVRATAVAKRLGLPAETVRRRVAHLTSRGACEHTPEGLLISAEILDRPQYAAIARRNLADLTRMFASLARLGALEAAPNVVRDAA